MNTKEILKTHNAWRRGDDTRSMDDLGFNVTELGRAIDDAVRAISERDKLRAELEECIRAWALTTSELAQERERAVSARAGGEVEPVAFCVFAPNGNIRIWWSNDGASRESFARKWAEENGLPLTKLYTYPPAAQDVRGLAEALDHLVSACELPGDHCEIEQALPAAVAALDAYREKQGGEP